MYLILLGVKQGGINYHFFSLWYNSILDWSPISRAFGEHSTHSANVCINKWNIRNTETETAFNKTEIDNECHIFFKIVPLVFNPLRFLSVETSLKIFGLCDEKLCCYIFYISNTSANLNVKISMHVRKQSSTWYTKKSCLTLKLYYSPFVFPWPV